MEKEDFINLYASNLNEQQLAGVTAQETRVLLLAVPGSGKTTVLVTRLGYLMMVRGIRPESVLTLTYTVSATRDVRNRYEAIFGEGSSEKLEFRTINGICAKIIQKYADLVGKPAYSLVTDERDTARILTESLTENLSDYPTESDVKTARTLITYCKNMMLTPEEIDEVGKKERFPLTPVFKAYNDYLKKHALMDYDDQLKYALTILRVSPEMLRFYQEQYAYVLVDEAQDTSKIQHEIIRLLASGGGSLFMVGDEDQSIYGFRAAFPEALLSFEKDYPGAKVLIMDQNYRSNAEIVAMADRLIGRNRERREKHMVASREGASLVNFERVKSRQAQYDYLFDVAKECDRQTAVLYRDNESALPLIDLLERKGIPYRMKNGDFSFFTSRVVTDVRNVLRLALNPYDAELFMKVYFKLQSFLKKDQALDMCRISDSEGMILWEASEEVLGIHSKTVERCKAIGANLRVMREEPPVKAISRLENSLGYGEYLERNGLDAGKLFLLKMLARQESTVTGFLERLEELQKILQDKVFEPKCKFILSTIHSSKGLEYDRVILMDVIDGVFPAVTDAVLGISEEERRLFYVGITRAMNDLTILCCENESSRFLSELKPVTFAAKASGMGRRGKVAPPSLTNDYLRPRQEQMVPGLAVDEGSSVLHKKYGRGAVIGVKRDVKGNATRIRVRFENGEERLFTSLAFQGAMKVE